MDRTFQRQTMTSQPTIYIPNLNGARPPGGAAGEPPRADAAGRGRRSSTTARATARRSCCAPISPRSSCSSWARTSASARRSTARSPPAAGDPVILLNNDVVCEPRFLEALLEPAAAGAEMVAGVLLTERDPRFIDSAGVIADRTLMGFDYLNGEPREAAEAAAAPLGPTGGAALYSRAAFDAVGGFDERIFLYYEDLDLALRLRARRRPLRAGAGRRRGPRLLADAGRGERRQVRPHRLVARLHAAPLRGDGPPARRPARARRRGRDLRRAAAQGPHREGARRAGCGAGATPAACRRGRGRSPRACSDLSLRRGPGAAPSQARAALRSPAAASRRRSRRSSGSRRSASSLPFAVASEAALDEARASDPASTAAIRGIDAAGMNLSWVASRLRATRREFSAPGVGEARLPDGVADVPDGGPGDRLEAPAGDPRPHVEVDVLAEGDVALVVAAELGEELAAQQAGGAADAERLAGAAACSGALHRPAPSSKPRPSRVSDWPAL